MAELGPRLVGVGGARTLSSVIPAFWLGCLSALFTVAVRLRFTLVFFALVFLFTLVFFSLVFFTFAFFPCVFYSFDFPEVFFIHLELHDSRFEWLATLSLTNSWWRSHRGGF